MNYFESPGKTQNEQYYSDISDCSPPIIQKNTLNKQICPEKYNDYLHCLPNLNILSDKDPYSTISESFLSYLSFENKQGGKSTNSVEPIDFSMCRPNGILIHSKPCSKSAIDNTHNSTSEILINRKDFNVEKSKTSLQSLPDDASTFSSLMKNPNIGNSKFRYLPDISDVLPSYRSKINRDIRYFETSSQKLSHTHSESRTSKTNHNIETSRNSSDQLRKGVSLSSASERSQNIEKSHNYSLRVRDSVSLSSASKKNKNFEKSRNSSQRLRNGASKRNQNIEKSRNSSQGLPDSVSLFSTSEKNKKFEKSRNSSESLRNGASTSFASDGNQNIEKSRNSTQRLRDGASTSSASERNPNIENSRNSTKRLRDSASTSSTLKRNQNNKKSRNSSQCLRDDASTSSASARNPNIENSRNSTKRLRDSASTSSTLERNQNNKKSRNSSQRLRDGASTSSASEKNPNIENSRNSTQRLRDSAPTSSTSDRNQNIEKARNSTQSLRGASTFSASRRNQNIKKPRNSSQRLCDVASKGSESESIPKNTEEERIKRLKAVYEQVLYITVEIGKLATDYERSKRKKRHRKRSAASLIAPESLQLGPTCEKSNNDLSQTVNNEDQNKIKRQTKSKYSEESKDLVTLKNYDEYSTEPLTLEEKKLIVVDIIRLPTEKINGVIEILRLRDCFLAGTNPNEIEVDFETLTDSTLRELQSYMNSFFENQ